VWGYRLVLLTPEQTQKDLKQFPIANHRASPYKKPQSTSVSPNGSFMILNIIDKEKDGKSFVKMKLIYVVPNPWSLRNWDETF
jgi:hypothetical protein